MYLPPKSLWSSVAIIPTLLLLLHTLLKKRGTRTFRVSPSTERVLILGASSGIGKEIALTALAGNYLGPLLSAVTFVRFIIPFQLTWFTHAGTVQIPMLESTSPSPSICQISSIASIIPAPTRSIYGSTKAASFILYRSLSIEHPRIGFSIVCPATVEGDFRGSAVDSGDVRESLKGALKAEFVARECEKAVNVGTKLAFMPREYWSI